MAVMTMVVMMMEITTEAMVVTIICHYVSKETTATLGWVAPMMERFRFSTFRMNTVSSQPGTHTISCSRSTAH